jgi:bifunctional non-homologous end joining protein LigD
MFVDPMLASPLPTGFAPVAGAWVAEEKFDGHRLVVTVRDQEVRAWARTGHPRVLPAALRSEVVRLADGTYDGELYAPGQRSYGVTELARQEDLVFVVFDLLKVGDRDITTLPWSARRELLELGAGRALEKGKKVRLSEVQPVSSLADVTSAADRVWARDGEGLILKKTSALYRPGKRSKDWLKVKQLRSAKLRIIGFEPGEMGPCSVVLLEDPKQNRTSVKWKNLDLLRQTTENPDAFIGRDLWIEYQERTPDGSYRHPRWDHLQ